MKNFKFLFSIAVASALIGCSSMSVDEVDALAGNIPADFNTQEYLELHPELLRVQIKDYIENLNRKDSNAYKALGTEAYDAFKKDSISADKAAFEADTATVRFILTNYAGYKDADWEKTLIPTIAYDVTYAMDTIAVGVRHKDSTEAKYEAVYVCPDSSNAIKYDATETTKVVEVVGSKDPAYLTVDSVTTDCFAYKDSTVKDRAKWVCAKHIYKYVCEGATSVFNVDSMEINAQIAKMGTGAGLVTLEDTTIASTKERTVPGFVDKNLLKEAQRYNYFGSRDDLAVLQAFQVDTFAISYQFSVYGQEHGWAYRKCKPTDNVGQLLYDTVVKPVLDADGQPMQDADGNPVTTVMDTVTAVYPMQKLYCADEKGLAHEIN